MSFLDFIFPKKCINCKRLGEFLCANCLVLISYNQNFTCPVCLKSSVSGVVHPLCKNSRQIDGVISTVSYNPIIKKLIYQFKYKPNLSKLSEVIGELMADFLSQNELFMQYLEKYHPVFVPIPLSAKRMRIRGYNHAELITYYVAQYFKSGMYNKLLVRIRDTKPQYKLNKNERIKNIEGSFQISINSSLPTNIVLIDDVATTFATLKEAAKVLKQAGVKRVLGVTFARDI